MTSNVFSGYLTRSIFPDCILNSNFSRQLLATSGIVDTNTHIVLCLTVLLNMINNILFEVLSVNNEWDN